MNIGIIGLGRISHKMADAIAKTEGAVLYAVGSRDLQKAEKFAAEHSALHAYGSYEALCEDKNIDAVYISTPHGRHYEDAMLAMANGKHVLCEKAMTVNAKLAAKMAAEAEARGLLLAEAMWTRYVPVNRHICGWLDDGRIGEIRSVNATIGFKAEQDFTNRLLDINLGGGALLDVGIYALEYIMMAYRGEHPTDVKATGTLFYNGADAVTTAALGFSSGTAQFTCALNANIPTSAAIYGSDGSIEVCGSFMAPSKAILHTKAGNEICEIIPDDNGFVYELAAFIKAISDGRTCCDELPPEESVLAAGINDEIKRQIDLVYPQDKI